MDLIYDVICVGFLPELARTTTIMAASSFLMYFGSIFIFLSGLRFGNADHEKKEDAEEKKKQKYEEVDGGAK